MAYPERWYSSSMQGAPGLSGTAGDGIALLDAVLVDGFGQLTLTSLAVSSGVATATYSGGHSYKQWSVIEIAGATPAGLNGQKRITSVDATTFTFAATGIDDGAATGTITAKIPGAGWTKAYSGANKAAYRLNSVTGTGGYLRVDDSGTTDMRWVGYMGMTDVDTGSDPFPTAAQLSGGMYARKSSVASATDRPWLMIADDRFFYLCVLTDGSSTYKAYCFGDFVSFAGSLGAWDCVIGASATATGTPALGYLGGASISYKRYIPRIAAGTGGAAVGTFYGHGNYSGDGNVNDTYPSPVTGGIVALDTVLVLEGDYNTLAGNVRGWIPGYIQFLNDCITEFAWETPYLLSGSSVMMMPIFTGDPSGDVFGVFLSGWR